MLRPKTTFVCIVKDFAPVVSQKPSSLFRVSVDLSLRSSNSNKLNTWPPCSPCSRETPDSTNGLLSSFRP
eukprot:303690-Pyramimonas_sp.AAC.1